MSQYSLERKESVLRRMVAPMAISMAQLSEETGISTWTLYNWRRQPIDKGEEAVVGSAKHSGKWSARQKFAVVVDTAAFNEAELAEYCRKKGLYPEQIKAWRAAAEQAMAGGTVSVREHRVALGIPAYPFAVVTRLHPIFQSFRCQETLEVLPRLPVFVLDGNPARNISLDAFASAVHRFLMPAGFQLFHRLRLGAFERAIRIVATADSQHHHEQNEKAVRALTHVYSLRGSGHHRASHHVGSAIGPR